MRAVVTSTHRECARDRPHGVESSDRVEPVEVDCEQARAPTRRDAIPTTRTAGDLLSRLEAAPIHCRVLADALASFTLAARARGPARGLYDLAQREDREL